MGSEIYRMGKMNDLGQIAAVGISVGILFAFVGAFISQAKGRPGFEGAVLGFIAGPIGWLVCVMMPTIRKPADQSVEVAPAKKEEPPKPANRRRMGGPGDDAAMDFVMDLMRQSDSESRSLQTEPDPSSTPRRPSEPSPDPRV